MHLDAFLKNRIGRQSTPGIFFFIPPGYPYHDDDGYGSTSLALCEGDPPLIPAVTGVDSPPQGPEMRRFDVSFVINLNNLLNKRSSCWRYIMTLMQRYCNIFTELWRSRRLCI